MASDLVYGETVHTTQPLLMENNDQPFARVLPQVKDKKCCCCCTIISRFLVVSICMLKGCSAIIECDDDDDEGDD